MAEALETFFSPALVRRLAQAIERVFPAFPSRAFVRRASEGLAELELLARGKHISAALAVSLPNSYPEAIEILLRSLGPKHATEELLGLCMAPFFYLPHVLAARRMPMVRATRLLRSGPERSRAFRARRVWERRERLRSLGTHRRR